MKPQLCFLFYRNLNWLIFGIVPKFIIDIGEENSVAGLFSMELSFLNHAVGIRLWNGIKKNIQKTRDTIVVTDFI
jgi:hypothetical protein